MVLAIKFIKYTNLFILNQVNLYLKFYLYCLKYIKYIKIKKLIYALIKNILNYLKIIIFKI